VSRLEIFYFFDLNMNNSKVQESSEIIVVDEKVQQDGKTIIKFRTMTPFQRGEAVRHEDYSTHFSISSKDKRSFSPPHRSQNYGI